ncbi:tyrosine--tRNA ligase, partial [Patescibacteria group bacterium]|nr:tyrosine--tRNA ligase [Patescibacteria group bacterium]
MNSDEKLKLITRNCQEVLVEKELKELLGNGTELKHYIGFEISGMVHLGTGLISMGKIADFVKAGVKCQIFLADFHSYLNNKLGGNWENIRWATENYFKEGLIASLKCFGVDENQIEFITGKELYTDNIVHWETFMEVGKHVTLSRNLRSISIMGKMQGKDVDMATLFYPPLQVADIFTMGVNLAHAGTDQRKAHVIARQVAKKLIINPLKNAKGKVIAPIAIHQNLIAGLSGPTTGENSEESLKMSKSKPGSAIFVHDTADEI